MKKYHALFLLLVCSLLPLSAFADVFVGEVRGKQVCGDFSPRFKDVVIVTLPHGGVDDNGTIQVGDVVLTQANYAWTKAGDFAISATGIQFGSTITITVSGKSKQGSFTGDLFLQFLGTQCFATGRVR